MREYLTSEDAFLQSDYYREYQKLLIDDKLAEYLERENIQLIFYPHFELQKYLKHFETKRKLLNFIGFQIGDGTRRAGAGVINNITVGSGTWICARSTVYNNIVIGNSCIVACCACVNKDVPDNSLVGGVPAKIIKVLE